MENFQRVTSQQSDRSRRMSENGQSQASSAYTVKSGVPNGDPNFQTTAFTSDMASEVPSSELSMSPSTQSALKNNKHIRLIPLKVKDVMQMIQSNPEYRDKSPVLINIPENSIDRILEQQKNGHSLKLSASPQSSGRYSPRSMRRSSEGESSRYRLEQDLDQVLSSSKPPLGEPQSHQVYAMHDIQAYPMIGGSNFRAGRSAPRRNRSRIRRTRVSPERQYVRRPRRRRTRSRRRVPRSRSRARSRPRRVVRIRQPRSVITVPRPPLFDACCTPFPLCENNCYPTGTDYYSPRYDIRHSRVDMTCSCNLCMEKLQFIQPGVCPKKKYMWTNEYAILPKPQVNLIDPCDELDPSIYPRSDNPCIRDSNGNPLTDCIGRPLRDPVGKRFLNFNANGSVMNTNFRGNFYTGQPPLCVKCPMPGASCAPDTTHNTWMSCGYPIMPNMNSYFQHVAANENLRR